ncbi:protein NLRC5-like [Protopterus annectens]|uniref:protein NLRC5-like n=1 Tax=Protopterus annectens TaxID=7888 RepID=UPI001CFA361E|nr:protein NLRC5-like [Protopterus annectens]
MEELNFREVLERNRSHLVEVLSHEMELCLQKATHFLSNTEMERVESLCENKDKLSLLLNVLMEKDPALFRQFIQCICIEYNDFPMELEIPLMAACGDVTPKRPCSTSGEGTDAKQLRLDTDKSVSLQSNEEIYIAPIFQEKDLDAAVLLGFAESYRHQIIKVILEADDIREETSQKQTIASQIYVEVLIRNMKVSKGKDRSDKGLQEDEESFGSTITVSSLLASSNCPKSNVIFLFGKAGIGKTVLTYRICTEWAKGIYNQFKLTFLFEFRQLNLIHKKVTLMQLFFDLFIHPENNPSAVFQYIFQNAASVLIIFDGFDQFADKRSVCPFSGCNSPSEPQSIAELFSSLYYGKLLPGCTVLVTSRPNEAYDLSNNLENVCNLRGFNQQKVEAYVRQFLNENKLCGQALTHLMDNKRILSHCYVPAVCFMVCVCLKYLFSSCIPGNLPETVTQLYIKILTIFLYETHKDSQFEKEETLLSKHRLHILGLCDLALKGHEDGRTIFYDQDISEKVREFALLYGLMKSFALKNMENSKDVGYAFMHVSLQEFLAALCMMISENIKESALKKKLLLKSKWALKNESKSAGLDSFHIFLSGLSSKHCEGFLSLLTNQDASWVQKKQKTAWKILEKLSATNLTGPKLIELCQCTYETQNLELATHIGEKLKCSYELRNFRPNFADMMAVIFVINSGMHLICLDIVSCSLELDCVEVLSSCRYIETLKFRSRKYGDKFAEVLAKTIPKIKSLKKLEFTGASITKVGLCKLAEGFASCLELEEINLQDNRMKDDDILIIIECLSKIPRLKKIDLSHNEISSKGVLSLVNAMTTCINISDLHVWGGSTAIVCLADSSGVSEEIRSRESCPVRKENEILLNVSDRKMRINDCRLNLHEVQTLVEILERCSFLSEVDLSGNHLEDEGCRILIDRLPRIKISRQLNLSNNGISVEGVLHLSNSLNSCPNVIEVDISLQLQKAILNFSQGSYGIRYLKRDVCSTKTSPTGNATAKFDLSRRLSVQSCEFQTSQLEKLCRILKLCPDLSELDLSNNALGNQGIQKLVHFLPDIHVSNLIKFEMSMKVKALGLSLYSLM